ncbi:MAG: polysaccharide deacetylase family protein [Sphingobacteriaceae bacterium]|nr:polysaccharide deacetylase family protein [Sphingobacteriaceae bacterium]
MYFVKTPFFLRWIYPGLTWRKPVKNTIFLTFDDGPIPVVTPFVLNVLSEYQAKATFFCIGDNVRKYPEIYKQVLDGGHSVGNHTFNHLKGWETADEAYIDNYDLCRQYVDSNMFRPPYGKIKKSQIAKLQQANPEVEIVMWDVLSGDFDADLKAEKCLRKTVNKTCSGSIVVFHDSLKAFPILEDVLPKALEFWKRKGYTFDAL